jgi:hypothetical protein
LFIIQTQPIPIFCYTKLADSNFFYYTKLAFSIFLINTKPAIPNFYRYKAGQFLPAIAIKSRLNGGFFAFSKPTLFSPARQSETLPIADKACPSASLVLL